MNLWPLSLVRAALAAALMAGSFQSAFAVDPPPSQVSAQDFKPASFLRDIFDAQVQMADGGTAASTAHEDAQRRAADAFLAADIGVWDNPSHMTILLIFTLSGGDAMVLRTVAASRGRSHALKALIDGVVAITKAENGKAAELLLPIRTRVQHPVLAAAVALAIAPFVQETDPNLALALYDETRLEAPGTLLEEAALRRKINLHIDQGQPLLAMKTFRLYFRRFPGSPYAPVVIERAAAGMAHTLNSGSSSEFSAVVETFKDNPAANVTLLILDLSRELLLAGKFQLARDTLARLPTGAVRLDAAVRTSLYRLTLKIGSLPTTEIEAELGKIDRTQLSEKDATILEVTRQIGVQPSYQQSNNAESAHVADRNAPTPERLPEVVATRERGKIALEAVEAALKLEGRP